MVAAVPAMVSGTCFCQNCCLVKAAYQRKLLSNGLCHPGYLRNHKCLQEDFDFVSHSVQASLGEMIAPGALVMLTPLVVGILFGTRTLSGVLAGALVSGVQMAVSMSNTGGAWDNAKKYVEVCCLNIRALLLIVNLNIRALLLIVNLMEA